MAGKEEEVLIKRLLMNIPDLEDRLRGAIDAKAVLSKQTNDLAEAVGALNKRVDALEGRMERNEKQMLVIDGEELKKTVTAVLGDGEIRYEGLIEQVNELQRRQTVMAIMQSINLTLSVILVGVLAWVIF